MPHDSGDLEEVDPDLTFFDPTVSPPENHKDLATSPGSGSSTQMPAVGDRRPTSTSLPVAGSQQNQRQHVRFRIEDVTAQLYAKGLLSTIGLGRANMAQAAVNLSEGGILILAKERFKRGSRLHVKIEVETVHDALSCDGFVRWCEESARHPGRFYVGVQFEKLSDLQRGQIRAMRTWFTSREYKVKSATRRRMRDSGIQPKV